MSVWGSIFGETLHPSLVFFVR